MLVYGGLIDPLYLQYYLDSTVKLTMQLAWLVKGKVWYESLMK